MAAGGGERARRARRLADPRAGSARPGHRRARRRELHAEGPRSDAEGPAAGRAEARQTCSAPSSRPPRTRSRRSQGVEALVPGAKKALTELPPVVKEAVPAVESLTKALKPITPILAGLRPYTPDVVAGFFTGVGGAAGAGYDANGHYLKGSAVIQAGGSTLTGLLNVLGSLLGNGDRHAHRAERRALEAHGAVPGRRARRPRATARTRGRTPTPGLARRAVQPGGRSAMRRAAAILVLLGAVGALLAFVFGSSAQGSGDLELRRDLRRRARADRRTAREGRRRAGRDDRATSSSPRTSRRASRHRSRASSCRSGRTRRARSGPRA